LKVTGGVYTPGGRYGGLSIPCVNQNGDRPKFASYEITDAPNGNNTFGDDWFDILSCPQDTTTTVDALGGTFSQPALAARRAPVKRQQLEKSQLNPPDLIVGKGQVVAVNLTFLNASFDAVVVRNGGVLILENVAGDWQPGLPPQGLCFGYVANLFANYVWVQDGGEIRFGQCIIIFVSEWVEIETDAGWLRQDGTPFVVGDNQYVMPALQAEDVYLDEHAQMAACLNVENFQIGDSARFTGSILASDTVSVGDGAYLSLNDYGCF